MRQRRPRLCSVDKPWFGSAELQVKHQHCAEPAGGHKVLPSPHFTRAQLAAELTSPINRPPPFAPSDQDCVLWSML
jgi:hypothetical protein